MAEAVKEPRDTSLDEEEFILRKRLPKRLPRRKTDIYVTRKTPFKRQLARCQKLLDSGSNELYIHGLGVAINRAVNLALQLQTSGNGSLELVVNTDTVELTDDLEPQNDQQDYEVQTRNNSAIHIKVFRPPSPTSPQPSGS